MNKQDVAIATITLARDEQEEALMMDSLEKLSKLHIPVFITDGGSRPGFIDFLRSFSQFILSDATAKGVWAQAKNSLRSAYQHGSPFIFYTEPDKADFFSNQFAQMLDDVKTDDKTGIIVASRSAAAFATFPSFQQMTETTINRCCAEIIGKDLEYTYGPFLLNKELVPYLELIKEDVGWGWRPYTFGIAKRLGYKIEGYEGDFFCPIKQQHDNTGERIYRMRQLSQNMQGMALSTVVELP